MKQKIKNIVEQAKLKAVVAGASVASAMTVLASAAEGDSATIQTAFQSGFSQLASDALGMIAIIVPIALGVAGTIFIARKAMGWFKSMAK